MSTIVTNMMYGQLITKLFENKRKYQNIKSKMYKLINQKDLLCMQNKFCAFCEDTDDHKKEINDRSKEIKKLEERINMIEAELLAYEKIIGFLKIEVDKAYENVVNEN